MRFGVREICDVVLRAKSRMTLGSRVFYKNEPVLYFETLKTSSLEGAATTVYAQGGAGNARLVAWEGDRTLTFVMEDALLSMESFSILSGAGLIDATEAAPIYVHQTSKIEVKTPNTIVVPDLVTWNGFAEGRENPMYHPNSDIFIMVLEQGEQNVEPCIPVQVVNDPAAGTDGEAILTCYSHAGNLPVGTIVLVDYYVKRTGGASMIEISADKFGGNYYLEASTLFRRESDGVDMPAEFIIPNCKIQSNFTFSMAATGDPSTFTFTLDAFPDYTKFDGTKKILAGIQVIYDETGETEGKREPCNERIEVFESEAGTVSARYLSNNAASAEIEVTGQVTGKAYNQEWYGTAVEKGGQITVAMPVAADQTQYKITTTNPVYKHFTTDPSITGNTKVQTRTGEELAEGVTLLFSNDDVTVPVTLLIEKINGDFSKLYTFNNLIEFEDVATGASYVRYTPASVTKDEE